MRQKRQFHAAIDDEDFKSIIKVVKNIGHKKHKLQTMYMP